MKYFIANVFFLQLCCTATTSSNRQHFRRSISYDDRWFGFNFEAEPQWSIFRRNSSIVIPCSFSLERERVARVEWRKDDLPITNSSQTLVHSNGSLILREPTSSDDGTYQCLVHVADAEGNTWTLMSKKGRVQEAAAIRWKTQPRNATLPQGASTAISCTLEDYDDGAYVEWMLNGKPLPLHGEEKLLSEKGGLLEVRAPSEQSSLQVHCVAVRGTQRLVSNTSTITSGTEWGELSFVASPPTTLTVLEGEEALLPCMGSPGSSVQWMKDGVEVREDEGRKIGSGSLLLSSVRAEWSGTYTCVVSDESDSIRASSTLNVHSVPSISSPPQDVIAKESSDIHLECIVSGRPAPVITWYKNGEMLTPSGYFLIQPQSLSILGVVKADKGMYECVGENEHGMAHAAAHVIVQATNASSVAASSGEPLLASPPQSLRVLSVGSREATLAWDAPKHGHGSILHYHIFYKEEESLRERSTKSTEGYRTLSGLHPSRAYQVRVAAENEAGVGQTSQVVSFTTKGEEQVPGPVTSLSAFAVGAESIQVEWGEPSSGPSPLSYKLIYSQPDSRDVHVNVGRATRYTMHGMDKFTEYNIRVEALGQNGVGVSGESVSVRTHSDVPSAPVLTLSALPSSPSSARVEWTLDERGANGPITHVRLRYKLKEGGSKATNLLINSSPSHYIVENLQAGATYQLRMAMVNANGTGPYSDWLTLGMPSEEDEEEDALPATPTHLTAFAGPTWIEVRWKPPHDDKVAVRKYKVGYGMNVPDTHSVIVEGDTLHYRIEGVKPNREYVVSVRGVNKMGPGFPAYETITTKKVEEWKDELPIHTEGGMSSLSEGGDSPMELRARTLSPTSIQLTWAPSSPSHPTVHYTVKYNPKWEPSDVLYRNVSDASCVLDRLKPGVEYEMAVRSFIPPSTYSAWSMSVHQHTTPVPPSSPPRDVTVLPAASGDPSAVTVNWQPPKYANGEMQGYTVAWTSRSSARESEWESVEVAADRLSTPIQHLLPKATYRFRVQGRNVKGVGPWSAEQVYSSAALAFLPSGDRDGTRGSVGTRGTDWLSLNGMMEKTKESWLFAALAALLFLLLLLLCILVLVCLVKKVLGGKAEVDGGRTKRRTDLWIEQAGVGGASSHLLSDAPSVANIQMERKRSTHSPPPFANTTLHRQQGSGTLSRSLQQSQSSLQHVQHRTPHMVYEGRRVMESPYASSCGLAGSGTPPPPSLAPPHPPLVSADSSNVYRRAAMTACASPYNGSLRTFSTSRMHTHKDIPVGLARPRVNVASVGSGYASSSGMSVEEEKERVGRMALLEDERSESSLPLPSSYSTSNLDDDVGNIDVMISDLQALQQQFGVGEEHS